MRTPDADELATRLARIPIVDQHCHSLVRDWQMVSAPDALGPRWRGCFSEAVRPESLERDVPAMRGYREFLRAFGRHLGVGPMADSADASAAEATIVEAAVVAARDARAADERYVADLLDNAVVTMLLVDTGYGADRSLEPAALEAVAGRPVRTIARLETLAERVLGAAHGWLSPAGFRDALSESIETELDAGAVGLKTIAAYRCGLDLVEPTPGRVRRALADRTTQARRLDDPALVALVVHTALAIAGPRGIPVQVHTGFGDEDLDLRTADPSLLRPLLRDPTLGECPIVLLHGHPFVAQAAYLASVFPQVYLDLSLTIPLLGAVGARAAISEALGLCPVTKILAASDGHSYPEMHWRGAALWRELLAAVLAAELRADRMTAAEAEATARGILGENAIRLYRLDP